MPKEIPQCGFAVTPRYAVGTRFYKDFPGYGTFEGRVVSFDGEFYEILYTDGDQEVFDASGFDDVRIITEYKRPTKHCPPSIDDNDDQSPITACPICTEFFSGDPSDKKSKRLPIQASRCAHVICEDCVEKIRLSTSKTNKLRKLVDCPLCKTAKSFDADNPTTCLTMCEMVQFCQEVKKRKRQEDAMAKLESRRKKAGRPDLKLGKNPNELFEKRQGAKQQNQNRTKTSGEIKKYKEIRVTSADEKPQPESPLSSSSTMRASLRTCVNCTKSKGKKDFHIKQWTKPSQQSEKLFCCQCEKSNKKCKVEPVPSVENVPLPHDIISSPSILRPDLRTCTNCKMSKAQEKFSTKQWTRSSQKGKKVYCRRCEEKAAVRKEVGRENEDCVIRIYVAKGDDRKFLTTVINTDSSIQITRELTLEGYTREKWSTLEDDRKNPECAWTTTSLRCLFGDVKAFLLFLSEHKKSAFGSFMFNDTTDVFFVIPFDQSACPTGTFVCKYVAGLGLDISSHRPRSESSGPIEEPIIPDNTESSSMSSSSFLGQLIRNGLQTSEHLAAVPKGSVKAAVDGVAAFPKRPQPRSSGGSDWFRPHISR